MKAIVQLYIRSGSLFGEEYLELHRDIQLPFTPFAGLKLQFSPQDFSENADFVERMQGYRSLASGILSIEEIYYHLDDGHFLLIAWETATGSEDMHTLSDQWEHLFGFVRVSVSGSPNPPPFLIH